MNRNEIAKEIYVVALAGAQNLSGVEENERKEMFREVAKLCFEASSAFFEIMAEMNEESV